MDGAHRVRKLVSLHPIKLSLVAIGGGNGTGRVLLAARPFFASLAAVVAVTDTGRSTGVARALVDMPAPGDVRSTLAAMAYEPDALIARLLQYRFHSPNVPLLDGMAFGNLLLAALTQMTGDFAQAVRMAGEMVNTMAQVFPVSAANTQLCAELVDGSLVEGELAVRGLNKPPIARLFLSDPTAHAYAPALDAIRQADMVVLGPGSFFTSVLATLVFDGMREALRETTGTVLFVCNTTTQPGQTDGYTAFDHVQRLVQMLGPGVLDAALINRSEGLDATLLSQYASEGLHLLHPDDDELHRIVALGVEPLARDYVEITEARRQIWNKQDTLRHDLEMLGMALWKLVLDRA
ncbi:MAG: YvcK family protein [Chloroflexaceae bacterium]|nr:YvcK family protein [Chloroflexaceae bacterium]NJL33465.1 YvcK family protein [Chloroflexaceae bacterium]NJO04845.1 YvcK family protein [Chloroflexaceae bacterium]